MLSFVSYAMLALSVTFVVSVGPRYRASTEYNLQNVAILEELKTITDLILRSQGKENPALPSIPVVHDCSTLREAGIRANGVYSVFPFTFKVYCDMTTDGGGWTVLQRRTPTDIHENFNRSWSDYRNGFGDLYGEFWLGLEAMHQLTFSWPYELRIDMVDYEQGPKHALYKILSVGPESDGYRLIVSNYSGDAGDALSLFHSGRRFSAFDKDQDIARNKSCAQEKGGGWWFHACYAAHLNGMYPMELKRESNGTNIRWWSNRENVLVLTSVEIKIRRRRDDDDKKPIPRVSSKTNNSDETRKDESQYSEESGFEARNETNINTDYEFPMETEEEIFFADPNAGEVEDEYNVTEYNGHRSDTNPWWMRNSLGED